MKYIVNSQAQALLLKWIKKRYCRVMFLYYYTHAHTHTHTHTHRNAIVIQCKKGYLNQLHKDRRLKNALYTKSFYQIRDCMQQSRHK